MSLQDHLDEKTNRSMLPKDLEDTSNYTSATFKLSRKGKGFVVTEMNGSIKDEDCFCER
jgi:hypothetical protein